MRGRKPTPTALKVVRGNPGKRPLNEDEPMPEIAAEQPAPPAYLSDQARAHWDVCAAQLYPLGLLTSADEDMLARYCETFARWVEAQKQLEAHGLLVKAQNGFPVASPYVGISNKCVELLNKMALEFGMTPSSRSRLVVGKKEKANPFLKYKKA